jgi:peptidoglycan hydrolase-like protein with peptidoglycan-binding domain
MKRIFGFAAQTVQENPALAGGVCTFVVAFTLVAANALYGQSGGHPGPLFATRDTLTTNSLPLPELREIRESAVAPHAHSLERVPVPTMRPRRDSGPAEGSSLVAEAQTALAGLGLYKGEIDGVYGPQTRDAVVAFEDQYGYARTGQVSNMLLRSIGEAPATATRQVSEARARALAAQDAAANTEPKRSPPDDALPQHDAALVARIQIGLINFGEDRIAVDGVAGGSTVAAIRSFQKRYGMAVDGAPSAIVVRKLEEIGALRRK